VRGRHRGKEAGRPRHWSRGRLKGQRQHLVLLLQQLRIVLLLVLVGREWRKLVQVNRASRVVEVAARSSRLVGSRLLRTRLVHARRVHARRRLQRRGASQRGR
jgi:hypothetical protein